MIKKSTTNSDTMESKKCSSSVISSIINDYDKCTKEQNSIKINAKEKWRNVEEDVIVKCFNSPVPSSKILGFDLDSTLIVFDGNKKANKNSTHSKSYELQFDKKIIVDKITEYVKKGYLIVIFTNQNTEEIKNNESAWTTKIDNLIKNELNFPLIVICAKSKNFYRKPSIGMFEIVKEFNQGMEIDLKNSIYVGDSAGRKKALGYDVNDYKDVDVKFAYNIGFMFYVPEAFFLNKSNKYPSLEEKIKKMHLYDKNDNDHINFNNKLEAIIFIGPPGSGKSTFCEEILTPKNYIRINQDTLKTRAKVIAEIKKNLEGNKNVVIDSTNYEKNKRKEYIKIIRGYKDYKIRCFWIDISKELCFHLNNLRNINKNRVQFSESVPKMVIHTYYKYLNPPTSEEGFDEIINVNFVPRFKNEEDKMLFYCLSEDS